MTAGDNFQNSDRIDSHERANDFATKCSLEAWERGDTQARIGNEKTIAQKTGEQSFLDFGTNDPLLLAQASSTPEFKTASQESQQTPTDAFDETSHRYFQSIYIHPGDRAHGFKGKMKDPGHAAVRVEDTGTGFKSDIVGLGPDHRWILNPIKSRGSLHRDTDDSTFEMEVRREISKEEFDAERKYVQQNKGKNMDYSLMFPKQCTTEAIKISSFGGWSIQVPKEKISPFLPAQATPNTLYEYFSKPQSIDLTNLDENGEPRHIEVYELDPRSNNDRNYVPQRTRP
ncbi:MAG: hypothetical protein K2X77_06275 [Candidatus Obscuribacterales bacterium]|jgi:hypothetical protein|nr:hypothetical protein [Candidatus Obscuribacterales bacterium]